MSASKTYYIVAGEPSGDALGGKLIHAMKVAAKHPLKFYGIGGARMQEQGVDSLFPMSELSIMGFVELIPHIPHMLKRIDETVADILAKKPDTVITIDSPGFTFRVAKKLQNSGIKLVHYVAPTVWAYKPERAAKIAALYDELLVLLPFEPPYFEKEGLKTHFIGHPIVEDVSLLGDKTRFYKQHNIAQDALVLTMLTGSRKTETKRLLPIYYKVIEQLSKQFPHLHLALPTVPALETELINFSKKLSIKAYVITNPQEKWDAYAASTAALAKSGTATLELALAGLPMVVTYKVSRFSAWMLRRMIQVDYVNLINILQQREVIPECLQEACNPERLSKEISMLLADSKKAKAQSSASKSSLELLGLGAKVSPSERAAKVVLS